MDNIIIEIFITYHKNPLFTKLATFLYVGVPCEYKNKKDSGIDEEFILQAIMKDAKESYNEDACVTLRNALL